MLFRSGKSIHRDQRRVVQKKCHGNFSEMCFSRRRTKNLREIHAGDCGHHASSRSLFAKAFRHGFFWLTARMDVENIVRTCDGYQRYARQDQMPAQALWMIPITWPFAVWGLDMVGPFKTSTKKNTHILVTVDKFTKWIEVEPVNKVDAATTVKFLKKIVYRFGFPHSIITDDTFDLDF